MPLSFIMPLAIALVAICIFINSSEEIAYLSASISLICLILTLVFAPLPLQILLLMGALLSNRLLATPVSPLEQIEEEKKIKLIYRGITYERSPSRDEIIPTDLERTNYLETPLLSASLNSEEPQVKYSTTRLGRAFLNQRLP